MSANAHQASDIGIIQSRHSRGIVPIALSQTEFAFGLATGDRGTLTLGALIELSKYFAFLSVRALHCVANAILMRRACDCDGRRSHHGG